MQVVTLRKKYVPAYIKCLQCNKLGGDTEIEEMDADLPEHTILIFRRLAHTKVWHFRRNLACHPVMDLLLLESPAGPLQYYSNCNIPDPV